MHINQIKHFLDVSETRSINQSASNLFISPQGLSRSISRLESEMGLTLFRRTNRGMELTEEGERFVPYALGLWSAYGEFQRGVSGISSGGQSEVSSEIHLLTAPLITVSDVLTKIMDALSRLYPSYNLHYSEMGSNEMKEHMVSLSADVLASTVAIATVPDYRLEEFLENSDGLRMECLKNIPMVARVAKSHPLASRRQVSRLELAHEKILCFNEPVIEEIVHYMLDDYGGPDFAFKGSIRNLIGRFPHAVSISGQINPDLKSDSIVTIPIQDTVYSHIVAISSNHAASFISDVIECIGRVINKR